MAKTYIVSITGRNNWSGYVDTDEIEIYAKNAADAVKQARAQIKAGGRDRTEGSLSYKARAAA